MTQIISVRVDEELYGKIKKLNIKITEVVRTSLENEIALKEREIFNQKVKDLTGMLKNESLGNFLLTTNLGKKGVR
jgi:hypothetical protein